MATLDGKSPYNLEITYQSNLKTGEIIIQVDYISDVGDDDIKHRHDHDQYVRRLLEATGILRGSCLVRTRYGNLEEVYRLEKREASWEWLKFSSQQITATASAASEKERSMSKEKEREQEKS